MDKLIANVYVKKVEVRPQRKEGRYVVLHCDDSTGKTFYFKFFNASEEMIKTLQIAEIMAVEYSIEGGDNYIDDQGFVVLSKPQTKVWRYKIVKKQEGVMI